MIIILNGTKCLIFKNKIITMMPICSHCVKFGLIKDKYAKKWQQSSWAVGLLLIRVIVLDGIIHLVQFNLI